MWGKTLTPKLLRPTRFSCTKDIKAYQFSNTTDIDANVFELENKAKNIDKY